MPRNRPDFDVEEFNPVPAIQFCRCIRQLGIRFAGEQSGETDRSCCHLASEPSAGGGIEVGGLWQQAARRRSGMSPRCLTLVHV